MLTTRLFYSRWLLLHAVWPALPTQEDVDASPQAWMYARASVSLFLVRPQVQAERSRLETHADETPSAVACRANCRPSLTRNPGWKWSFVLNFFVNTLKRGKFLTCMGFPVFSFAHAVILYIPEVLFQIFKTLEKARTCDILLYIRSISTKQVFCETLNVNIHLSQKTFHHLDQ